MQYSGNIIYNPDNIGHSIQEKPIGICLDIAMAGEMSFVSTSFTSVNYYPEYVTMLHTTAM